MIRAGARRIARRSPSGLARVLNNPARCRFLLHRISPRATRGSLLPRRPGPAAAILVPGTRSGIGLNARVRDRDGARESARRSPGRETGPFCSVLSAA